VFAQPAVELIGEGLSVFGTEVRGAAANMTAAAELVEDVAHRQPFTDIGGCIKLAPRVDGFYAQICRTLVVGEPNAEQRKAHALWLESMEAGIAVVRDGVTAADIARAENDVFRAHGLGEYTTSEYTRVRGHGLGLFVDTKPHILEDVNTRIDAGMTLIVHPNTYHPVVGYMVLGDSLVVTRDGCEVVTATPRELFSVPV